MRRIHTKACRLVFLLVLAAAAAWAVGNSGEATHSYDPPSWWPDLKPWGDHSITYLLCGLPYDLPAEWGWGVENWDAQIGGYMDFDVVVSGCFGSADTWLVWDLQNACPSAPACFLSGDYQWHSTGWLELKLAYIYFNRDQYENLGQYNPAWETAFQTLVAAHEWGHNLNLDDHERDPCLDPHLLMGNRMNIQQPPCLTGPTSAERSAVIADYGLLDLDGDGFTGAVEWYVGTDQADACPDSSGDAAWPLDINNDRYVTVVGDVSNYTGRLGATPGSPNWRQRLDLNTDAAITVTGDVLKYRGKINATCT